MRVSFLRAGAGFIVGGGIGFAPGIANGLSPTSHSLTDTTLQMLRNIPHLALIPLVILWFGIDEGPSCFSLPSGYSFRSISTHCTAFAASIRSSSRWVAAMA
jgi:sulfonate transport system permease protein